MPLAGKTHSLKIMMILCNTSNYFNKKTFNYFLLFTMYFDHSLIISNVENLKLLSEKLDY